MSKCRHRKARYLGTAIHYIPAALLPEGEHWFSDCFELTPRDHIVPTTVHHCPSCFRRIERDGTGKAVAVYKVVRPHESDTATDPVERLDVYVPTYDGVDAAARLDDRPSLFDEVRL